jgi:hypothetical protein
MVRAPQPKKNFGELDFVEIAPRALRYVSGVELED